MTEQTINLKDYSLLINFKESLNLSLKLKSTLSTQNLVLYK